MAVLLSLFLSSSFPVSSEIGRTANSAAGVKLRTLTAMFMMESGRMALFMAKVLTNSPVVLCTQENGRMVTLLDSHSFTGGGRMIPTMVSVLL